MDEHRHAGLAGVASHERGAANVEQGGPNVAAYGVDEEGFAHSMRARQQDGSRQRSSLPDLLGTLCENVSLQRSPVAGHRFLLPRGRMQCSIRAERMSPSDGKVSRFNLRLRGSTTETEPRKSWIFTLG